MKKFSLPKSILTVEGASAMAFSGGFVSQAHSETLESSMYKVEDSAAAYGRDLYTCEGTYGNCLPTFVCCEEED